MGRSLVGVAETPTANNRNGSGQPRRERKRPLGGPYDATPPSFRLEVRGLEQLGAAGKVVRDELRESLRRLRGGLDAERRKTAFRAKLFHRGIDPSIDRLDEIVRHAGRSPHRPPRTEIQCGKPELGHGGDLRRKRATPSAAQTAR